MRATFIIFMVAGVFFWVGSVVPRQQEVLGGSQALHLPVSVASSRIASYADKHLPACFRALHGDAAELARAIVAVEYVSVNPLEQAVEYVVAKFAQFSGAPLPDLSYGAAQIRPSTLAKLNLDESLKASDFVDDCASIRMGQQVIASLLEKHQHVQPSHYRVLKVIREYSGQKEYRPEHIVYNAIVARLYADYLRKRDSDLAMNSI